MTCKCGDEGCYLSQSGIESLVMYQAEAKACDSEPDG